MKQQNDSVAAIGVLLGALTATSVAADTGLDKCIEGVLKARPGDIEKVEALDVEGERVYELEVRDAKGAEWEYMCAASSGEIQEEEAEAESAEDSGFKKHMKVSEKEAVATALSSHPGKVQELEYEIKSDGTAAAYEIDIVADDGVETKVEVDAATGEITEVSTEKWQIGIEADEMR